MSIVARHFPTRYPSQGSFFNPERTADGEYYAPIRFRDICRDEYIISSAIHTSFTDLEKVTPKERQLLLEFIREEREIRKAKREEELQEMKTKRK